MALCDVDAEGYAAHTIKQYPKAAVYKDFRQMFDKQKDIDAVIVATPDHSHAMIGLAAIERGKHVYIQKPLAHSVSEARLLTEAAASTRSPPSWATRVIRATACGCSANGSGTGRSARSARSTPGRTGPSGRKGIEVGRPKETPPVPASLDWDLWIGPAAMRPYHPTYHPGNWRAWWDFGTGSLGDLGCHILDAPFWALKLKYPTSVEGCISTYWHDLWKPCPPKNENYPRSTIVRFKFPAREGMPEVKLTWWDGGMMPPRPEELEPGRRMGDDDGGVLFVGDKGLIDVRLLRPQPAADPGSQDEGLQAPPNRRSRIPGGQDGHEKDWVRACKGGKPASSNFEFSGPLVRNGAHGEPSRPLSQSQTALGRREDGSHQRRRSQRLRPPALSRGLDAVGVT